ncbi:hypothetical protein V5N11_029298 [Cardamine amara subsp. amara]|uniref:Uncharacterized protein n=1 Tax=Cardamine amara subsp. amara TaxID=228776 RepID=A0ABD1AAS8_CARAN
MRSLQHNKIIFESTSTLAVSGVLQPRKTPVCRILISEIQEALRPLEMWKIQSIDQGRNHVAYKIALSDTKTNQHQSYVATGGPSWLSTLINSEAQGSVSES